MSLKNPRTLKASAQKKKAPASNVWATNFKNADFSLSSLENTKLSKF